MPINKTPTMGSLDGFKYEYARPGRALLKASKKAREIYEEVFEKVSQLTHSYALECLKIYIDFEGQSSIYCKQAMASHFREIKQWQTFGPLEAKLEEDYKVLRVGPIEISLNEIEKILSPKAWAFSKPRTKLLKDLLKEWDLVIPPDQTKPLKGVLKDFGSVLKDFGRWGFVIPQEIPKDIEFILVCAVWAGSFGIYSHKFWLKGCYEGFWDPYEGVGLASFLTYLSKEKAEKFKPVIEDLWDDV